MCSVNWPGAGDEEAHFILAVRVLVEELLAKRGAIGVIGFQADHVDGLIAFVAHEPVDVVLVRGDDFVLARARHDRLRRFPLLEAHADLAEFARDVGVVRVHRERLGAALFVVDALDGSLHVTSKTREVELTG